MEKRKLTVGDLWRNRAFEDGYVVPQIRLNGKWLDEAGFQIGDKVEVEVMPGCLTINRIWDVMREEEDQDMLLKRTSLQVTSSLAAVHDAGVGSVIKIARPLIVPETKRQLQEGENARPMPSMPKRSPTGDLHRDPDCQVRQLPLL